MGACFKIILASNITIMEMLAVIDILRTAEIAGHSVRHNGKQHYLLANVALVGESIMLAMSAHFK